MAPNLRHGLALFVPLLLGIAVLLPTGQLWPADPPPPPANVALHTIDRGGLIRWNNGKADVQTSFKFNLDQGNTMVPVAIGTWNGIDFPMNLEAYTSVAPEVLVNRLYRGPEGDIAFAVVGSNMSRKLHRPEICYAAANWDLGPLKTRTIALENGGEITINQFWTRAPEGEARVVLYAFVWQDARRRIEDGAFITQIGATIPPGGSEEEAAQRAERFLRQVILKSQPAPALIAFGA